MYYVCKVKYFSFMSLYTKYIVLYIVLNLIIKSNSLEFHCILLCSECFISQIVKDNKCSAGKV